MEFLKRKPIQFDNGTEDYIYEVNHDDFDRDSALKRNAMCFTIRYVYRGGDYIYDYWNDVVPQPETFLPYGYVENKICKKFNSYYTIVDVSEGFEISDMVHQLKENILVQHFKKKNNYVFFHLKDEKIFTILKLVVPGIKLLTHSDITKIRVENV